MPNRLLKEIGFLGTMAVLLVLLGLSGWTRSSTNSSGMSMINPF